MTGTLVRREERREELIGGKRVAMSPASAGHAYVSDNILRIFKNYLKGKTCIPFGHSLLVHLSEEDKFVPDVMVVCEREKIKPNGVHGAPDLVVEVLSPSTAKNDRTYKKEVYERYGVPEYWLVSPSDKFIEVYRQVDGAYVLHDMYTFYPDWMLEDMSEAEQKARVTEFKCHLYDDLIIRLDDIFGDLF